MSRDYSNGRIYVIRNNINDDIYVGSTTQPLRKRTAKHRSEISFNKLPLYEKFREFGVENFYIELLKEYPCENSEQLQAEEGKWIREMGTLNKKISGRSVREWREDHKEEQSEKKKQYREDHKEEIKEWKKNHYEENKEEILAKQKEKYEENKEVILERNKKWRDEHQEEQKDYHKKYRENNKEAVSDRKKKCYENKKEEYLQKKRDYYQRNKEKRLCECGSMVSSFEKSRHLKSQKHQAYLNNQQEN